jgi:hypothetical protein
MENWQQELQKRYENGDLELGMTGELEEESNYTDILPIAEPSWFLPSDAVPMVQRPWEECFDDCYFPSPTPLAKKVSGSQQELQEQILK